MIKLEIFCEYGIVTEFTPECSENSSVPPEKRAPADFSAKIQWWIQELSVHPE